MNTHRIRQSARVTALSLIIGVLSSIAVIAPTLARIDPDSPADISHRTAASTLFEIVFNGDADAPEALVSADAVIHTPYGEFIGPEGLQRYLGIIRSAYPDASFAVSSIDEQGDTVTVRWTMTASRYAIGPNEPVLDVLVRRSGETTITVADGQVAGITQTHHQTAIAQSTGITFMDGPSE